MAPTKLRCSAPLSVIIASMPSALPRGSGRKIGVLHGRWLVGPSPPLIWASRGSQEATRVVFCWCSFMEACLPLRCPPLRCPPPPLSCILALSLFLFSSSSSSSSSSTSASSSSSYSSSACPSYSFASAYRDCAIVDAHICNGRGQKQYRPQLLKYKL